MLQFTLLFIVRQVDFDRKLNFFKSFYPQVVDSEQTIGKEIFEHDVNFLEILKFFNQQLDLNIGIHHTFLISETAMSQFKTLNIGADIGLFRGIIRFDEATLPCDGRRFRRAYVATRPGQEIHVVNRKCDIINTNHKQNKIKQAAAYLSVREILDITGDAGTSEIKVIETIDIEQPNSSRKSRQIVKILQKKKKESFERCLFCNQRLSRPGSIRNHLDLCSGKKN